jgi:hypothetical protein
MLLDFTDQSTRLKKSYLRTIGLIASFAFVGVLSTTLAANISLSSNQSVEFGQGIVVTGTCDSHIVVRPVAAFDGQRFIFDSLEIQDISTLNHDNSFSIQVFNETSSAGLLATPAVIRVGADGISFTKTSSGDNTTLETITIDSSSNGGGARNEIGASAIRLKSITSDGVNTIPASESVRITLQSSGDGDCSRVYALGDIGPAGGTIGILPTTAGNTTGKYFEIGTRSANSMPWCGASDFGYSNSLGTSTSIGSGAANTALIAANCASGPGYYADQYTQGGYSDWFLPSAYELNAMKDIAPSGGYATSSERGATTIFYQNIPNGQPVLNDHAGKWFSLLALPIRSFTN